MASEQETILKRMIGKHAKRADRIRKIKSKLHTQTRKIPLRENNKGRIPVKR